MNEIVSYGRTDVLHGTVKPTVALSENTTFYCGKIDLGSGLYKVPWHNVSFYSFSQFLFFPDHLVTCIHNNSNFSFFWTFCKCVCTFMVNRYVQSSTESYLWKVMTCKWLKTLIVLECLFLTVQRQKTSVKPHRLRWAWTAWGKIQQQCETTDNDVFRNNFTIELNRTVPTQGPHSWESEGFWKKQNAKLCTSCGHVSSVNFLHKNSHRELFGGLKRILITILSIWLCTLSMANSFSEWRWNVCDQHDWITLFGSQIMYVTFQDCPIVSRPINYYECKRYSKNDYEWKRYSKNDYECKRYSKNDYECKR